MSSLEHIVVLSHTFHILLNIVRRYIHVWQTTTVALTRRHFLLINETCDILRIACSISPFNKNSKNSRRSDRVVNKSNSDSAILAIGVLPFSLINVIGVIRGNRKGTVRSYQDKKGMIQEGVNMRMVAREVRRARCWCFIHAGILFSNDTSFVPDESSAPAICPEYLPRQVWLMTQSVEKMIPKIACAYWIVSLMISLNDKLCF